MSVMTLDEQRVAILEQGLQRTQVAEALAVFAVASQLSPAPQLVATSQSHFSVGANA